jgi:hypothetical protein
MTLGNMRHLGVQGLIAYCLNPSCGHEGLIGVLKYPDDGSAGIRQKGRLRQMRGAWPAYRRSAELERAAGTAEFDREAMAVLDREPNVIGVWVTSSQASAPSTSAKCQ